MRIDIITIFPDYFAALDLSLVGKARTRGLLDVAVHDLRDYTDDPHRSVDDAPVRRRAGDGDAARSPGAVRWSRWLEAPATLDHGGRSGRRETRQRERQTGAGAPSAGRAGGAHADAGRRPRIVFPTPSGVPFTQRLSRELAGRSPGSSSAAGATRASTARVLDAWADDEVSLGDYVLAGGEVADVGDRGGGDPSRPRRPGQRGVRRRRLVLRRACWRGRSTRARPPSTGEPCRTCCCRATMPRSHRWRRVQALLTTAPGVPDLLARATLSRDDVAVLEAAGLGVPAEIARRMAQ